MARITIDNVEYPMEQIPDIARSHLSHIQFIDQEIARLQSQIAVLQTARQAYAKAVRSALPAPDASSAAASTPCFV